MDVVNVLHKLNNRLGQYFRDTAMNKAAMSNSKVFNLSRPKYICTVFGRPQNLQNLIHLRQS